MFTIYTKSFDGGPFNCRPAGKFDIPADKIICNDVMLPAEIDASCSFNCNHVRLWVVGNEYGALFAIFAGHEQDALDSACDAGMMESFALDANDTQLFYNECDPETGEHPDGLEYTHLGNAGELHDLEHCWIAEADFQAERDIQFIVKLARAAEGGHNTLDF